LLALTTLTKPQSGLLVESKNDSLSRLPGREGVPLRRKHATRQQKALASVAAAGSPHKRAAAPLCIPCWLGRSVGTLVLLMAH
jgi:hypothetical protein